MIVRGSGRIRVEDEIVEVGQWDAVRFDKDTMRAVEAGPDGIEYVAFGAGDDARRSRCSQDFWPARRSRAAVMPLPSLRMQ